MPFEEKEMMEITDSSGDSDFLAFAANGKGIMIAPQSYGEPSRKVLFPEANRFAKWMKAQHSDVQVQIARDYPALDLRGNDVWMPLVYLAGRIALPVFLNIVSNYLYDRLKGKLKGDRPIIHLDVRYIDMQSRTGKSLKFKGDIQAFERTMKQLSDNNLLE